MFKNMANDLADKIYEGLQMFVNNKIEALANILPELAGLCIIISGILMMFGDLKKGLTRTGVVAFIGATLVVIL